MVLKIMWFITTTWVGYNFSFPWLNKTLWSHSISYFQKIWITQSEPVTYVSNLTLGILFDPQHIASVFRPVPFYFTCPRWSFIQFLSKDINNPSTQGLWRYSFTNDLLSEVLARAFLLNGKETLYCCVLFQVSDAGKVCPLFPNWIFFSIIYNAHLSPMKKLRHSYGCATNST